MPRKLYRSNSNKMIGGVCAGLGEFFDVDPSIVRVISVIFALVSMGWAVLAYVIAWIIIPEGFGATSKSNDQNATPEAAEPVQSPTWTRYLPGLILIFIGSVLLIREHWFWFSWSEFWPILLVGVGLALIFWRRRVNETSETNTQNNHVNAHSGGTVS